MTTGNAWGEETESLPVYLRDPDLSLNSFKTKLKTFFLDILLAHNHLVVLFIVRANVIVYKLARY